MWRGKTGAPSVALAIGLAGVALVACGDNSDELARADEGQKQTSTQGASGAPAAQRLETYLEDHAKQLPRGHAKGGLTISFVEVSDGDLKIWTFLNSDIQAEEAKAAKVCRVAKRSGVPEAKRAVVVDGGGVELQRC